MLAPGAAVALVAISLSFASVAPAQNYDTPRQSAPSGQEIRFVVTAAGNEVRYRVREQLARLEFPNDAVGKTSAVQGQIVVTSAGQIVRESSRFVVDASSLVSDQSRRDNYVRRNTLQTDQYPSVSFVPHSTRGITAAAISEPGEHTFELLGELTIRNVARPVVWQVRGRRAANGELTGTATTSFTFADFEMTKPRVAVVLTVEDTITLEYDFKLAPQR